MVKTPSQELIIIGGLKNRKDNNERSDKLYKLTVNEGVCNWKQKNKMKITRMTFVAMAIPDNMVTSCEGEKSFMMIM